MKYHTRHGFSGERHNTFYISHNLEAITIFGFVGLGLVEVKIRVRTTYVKNAQVVTYLQTSCN